MAIVIVCDDNTAGVVGLGAIGSLVAEMALGMGMEVLGYDPGLSVESAWRLSNQVQKMDNLPTLLEKSDYVTLHLPMLESTKYMINEESLKFFRKGARLFNFSREGIIDPVAVEAALDAGVLSHFVADFAYPNLMSHEQVILLPHLGASTAEAEENCAVMAANQIMEYLKNGNVINSVNFPNISLDRTSPYRFTFSNKNVPNMLAQVTSLLANHGINVKGMRNKSQNEIAYNILNLDNPITEEVATEVSNIDGVLSVRIV